MRAVGKLSLGVHLRTSGHFPFPALMIWEFTSAASESLALYSFFWQDVSHLVTTELIRKVQSACPERKEESEDEAAPGSATVEESPLLLEQWGQRTDAGLRMWREWERKSET